MKNNPANYVGGSETVVAIFGKWPSFHDAEILSFNLSRDEGHPNTAPTVLTDIHIFDIDQPPESDARKNHLLTLTFFGVEGLELSGFDHQNAISVFRVSTSYSERLKRDIIHAEFAPGTGFHCRFDCARIEVVKIEPFLPKWGAYA